MELSNRIQSVKKSGTVQFTTLIKNLRQEDKEIIDFAVGDPEFSTLSPIIKATQKALSHGKTKYDEVSGVFALRSAIAKLYNGYDENNIIISNGSKQVLFNLFQVILNPEDEVILIRPHWPSFSQQIKIAGGVPVVVDSKRHQLDLSKIEKAITNKTKAIVINSPNNPTGAIYPLEDLRQIAQMAIAHDFFIISDEAYASIIYDGEPHHSIFSIEEAHDRTLIIGSFSKSYYMSGFRVGYMAAQKHFIDSITRMQEHTTGNVCTFAQYGAIAALSMEDGILEEQQLKLSKKRDMACGYASKRFDLIRPQGAFYLFLDVSKYLNEGETSEEFGISLLGKTGVAVIPGEVFDMPKHIRISFAVSDEKLTKGFDKIDSILNNRI